LPLAAPVTIATLPLRFRSAFDNRSFVFIGFPQLQAVARRDGPT